LDLTVRDVAKLLGVSEKTVYRWLKERRIPAYRLQEQYRFNRAEILEWATSQRLPIAPELLPQTPAGQAPPELAAALQQGGIHYRLQGEDKAAVLRQLVDVMRLPAGLSRDFVLELLLAREAMQSTAVGDGVALPHPRSPLLSPGSPPQVTLAFLENPVDFGALDGKPVFALFSVLAPTIAAHLQLLARIAFALRDQEFYRLILEQAGRQEILAAAAQLDKRFSAKNGVSR
jgi:PTS system nitrogen regulatory IIA component